MTFHRIAHKSHLTPLLIGVVIITCCLAVTGIVQLNQYMSMHVSSNRSQPAEFRKKDYTQQRVTVSSNTYHFEYTFKDHADHLRTWQWTYDKQAIDSLTARIGIPPSMLGPYISTPEIRKRRKQILSKGMFRIARKTLKPDYSKIVIASLPMIRPLNDLMQQRIEQDNLNWYETVDLALSFCQDIPYGIPPDYKQDGRVSGELLSPPECLTLAYGDCDTKALLFASILCFNNVFELLFVEVPHHLFIAIQGVPRPYDKFFSYAGKKWIYCEPTGPGRYPFGSEIQTYPTIEGRYSLRVTQGIRTHISKQPQTYTYSDTLHS